MTHPRSAEGPAVCATGLTKTKDAFGGAAHSASKERINKSKEKKKRVVKRRSKEITTRATNREKKQRDEAKR